MARLSDRVVTGAPNGILSNDEPIQWYAADGITLIDGIKVDPAGAVYLAPAGGPTEVGGNLDVTGNTTTPAIGLGTSTLANATTTWQHQVQGDTLAFSRYDTTGTSGSNAAGVQLFNEGALVGGVQYSEATGRTFLIAPDGGQNIYMEAGSTTVGTDLTVTGNIEASERIRLGNNKLLQARNQQNTQWRSVLTVDTNNDLVIGSSATPITLDVDTTVTGDLDVSGGHIQIGTGTTRSASLGLSLNVSGGHTAANFNPDVSGEAMIEATSISAPAGAGGGIQMGAVGRVNCAIRSNLTNGSGNTIGDMVFSTRRGVTNGTLTETARMYANGNARFAGAINAVGTIESGTYSNVGATSGCKIFQTGTVTISTTTTSLANRINFYNPNGLVGRIRTTGTATQYVTSSDPRLKSEFTPITGASEMILEARDQGMIGEFTFLSDPTQTIWGYNAHKVADLQAGFGGSEGEGPRDLEIGAVYEEAVMGERPIMVAELDDEGEPTGEMIESGEMEEYEVSPEKVVSPAGIDQSKRVPMLEAAIGELLDRIKVLEEAGVK